MMDSAGLADAVLFIHLLFILGVVLPVPLIWLGGAQGWAWTRRAWFRLTHFAMIGFVIAESLLGMMCPLTVLENTLRLRAGQGGDGDAFIAYWTHRLFFYDFPSWVFTCLYVAFGGLIAFLYWRYPPKKAGSSSNRHPVIVESAS